MLLGNGLVLQSRDFSLNGPKAFNQTQPVVKKTVPGIFKLCISNNNFLQIPVKYNSVLINALTEFEKAAVKKFCFVLDLAGKRYI